MALTDEEKTTIIATYISGRNVHNGSRDYYAKTGQVSGSMFTKVVDALRVAYERGREDGIREAKYEKSK